MDGRFPKVLATTTEDAMEPLRDERSHIVEGKPNPSMLVFFLPKDLLPVFDVSGLAVNKPTSKLLPE